MNGLFKEWLRMAYQQENPAKFLYQFLTNQLKKELTVANVNRIIGDVRVTSSPISDIRDDIHPMRHLQEDIHTFQKLLDRGKPSNDTLIAQFCYFATSLVHLFLNPDDSLIVEEPILAYVQPNVALPYVWFNVNNESDTRLELVKHHFIDVLEPLRVIVHVVDIPGSLVSHRLSFDLNTGECMQALNGNFMQIAIVTYERRAHLQSACKKMDCVVILTYENILYGVYFNDSKLNFAHACVYSAHY